MVVWTNVDWITPQNKHVQERRRTKATNSNDSNSSRNNGEVYRKDHQSKQMKIQKWRRLHSDESDEQREEPGTVDWSHSSPEDNVQHRDEDTNDDEELRTKRDYSESLRRIQGEARRSKGTSFFVHRRKEDPKRTIDPEWRRKIWCWIDIVVLNDTRDKDKESHSVDENLLEDIDHWNDSWSIDQVHHHNWNIPLASYSLHKYKDKYRHGNRDESNEQYTTGDIE